MRHSRFLLPLAALVAATGAALAGPPPASRAAPAPRPTVQPDTFTPAARADLTRRFVRKWGAEVQRTRGTPVHTWAMRSVPLFVQARRADFERALARGTLEGALAELLGHGARVSDADVAKLGGTKALGELNRDLVYTPIQPCRVVDTRNVPTGYVDADTPVHYRVVGASSFASQGGDATNCGTPATGASAVVLNVTVVLPGGPGYATLYPYGSAQPLASSLNYPGRTVVNNTVMVGVPNPMAAADVTLYTYRGSHFVIDIVGYYRPKPVPAMDCNIVRADVQTYTGEAFGVSASCAAGFAPIGAGCVASQANSVEYDIHGVVEGDNGPVGMCAGKNRSNNPVVTVHTRCCRVLTP